MTNAVDVVLSLGLLASIGASGYGLFLCLASGGADDPIAANRVGMQGFKTLVIGLVLAIVFICLLAR